LEAPAEEQDLPLPPPPLGEGRGGKVAIPLQQFGDHNNRKNTEAPWKIGRESQFFPTGAT